MNNLLKLCCRTAHHNTCPCHPKDNWTKRPRGTSCLCAGEQQPGTLLPQGTGAQVDYPWFQDNNLLAPVPLSFGFRTLLFPCLEKIWLNASFCDLRNPTVFDAPTSWKFILKPAVQSLTHSVLCSALFDLCPSCTLDEDLLKARSAFCCSCSVALCTGRVPSHGWSFCHLIVGASKSSQRPLELCSANWLKQQCPGNQRIWVWWNSGICDCRDFSLVNAAHGRRHNGYGQNFNVFVFSVPGVSHIGFTFSVIWVSRIYLLCLL